EQFGCWDNEIWLDPKKGELCRGPEGPKCKIFPMLLPARQRRVRLKDGTFLRFLAGVKSKDVDRWVTDLITEQFSRGVPEVEVIQPTIFSTLTNTTIAVGDGLWKGPLACLGEREVMENGATTRFMLKDKGDLLVVLIDEEEEYQVWMSQALSVFHVRGISLDDDLSQFKLLVRRLTLSGYLSASEITRQQRREKPVYLFVHPHSTSTPPTWCTTSSFHRWSLDPTGQHPLPVEICEDLGLPVELSLQVYSTYRHCWRNRSYKWIHQYQLAGGFNPKTTDFARHLGYPIYQVQNDSDRFEGDNVTPASPAQSSPAVSTSLKISLNKDSISSSRNHRSISSKIIKHEEGVSGKRKTPQMTSATSLNLRTASNTPGNAISRIPVREVSTESMLSVSTPPRTRPQTQPLEPPLEYRIVTRGTTKPGITSGKVVLGSSRAPRVAPVASLPSKLIHTTSPSCDLPTPGSAPMTPASTGTAKPSASTTHISRPRTEPSSASAPEPRASQRPKGGYGIERNVGDPRTYNAMEAPSKRVQRRRDPTIPARPTARPTNDHERSSSGSRRVWR
ncbi:hypothetical protein V5O48_018042, partial [Marasmius crinis-equi]